MALTLLNRAAPLPFFFQSSYPEDKTVLSFLIMLPNFSSGLVCLSLCRFITLLVLPEILPWSLLKLLLSLGNNVYFLFLNNVYLLTVPSFSASTFSNRCSSVGY